MRTIRYFLAVGAVLAPVVALAQAPFLGTIGVEPCDAAITDPGEFYATKLTNNPADAKNDMLFDLRAKGGLQSNLSTTYDSTAGGWNAAAAWRVGQGSSHVEFAVLTFAPATPGGPGRFSVDSATVSDFDAGVNRLQQVGNSIPAGNLNSVGVTIPGTMAQFGVQVRPGNTRQFPVGTTTNGINIAWADVIDINDTQSGAFGCSWGAKHADPTDSVNTPVRHGAIIGYNIYRMPGAATAPTPAQVRAALMTPATADGGWVGFIDTRTLRRAVADANPAGPGGGSPIEVNALTDIGGMQNPNGTSYDGDEVVIFQDSANTPGGVARPGGAALAPDLTQSYWYFVQPCMVGRVSDFASVGFTTNIVFNGDHTCDMDGDTVRDDGVDLDAVPCNTASAEFISPQAGYGFDGLGLTFNNAPLLSAGMYYDATLALPAFGQVQLSGTVAGSNVDLQFTTGQERGSVLGYNVYRVAGENRVRVNEQPILAQGNDSNVYVLVDSAVQALRGGRTGSIEYSVEIVYSDGTPSVFVGPFSVQLQQQAPARRRR